MEINLLAKEDLKQQIHAVIKTTGGSISERMTFFVATLFGLTVSFTLSHRIQSPGFLNMFHVNRWMETKKLNLHSLNSEIR